MVHYWCACWRAQHGCVLPVLLRTGKLRREEPGFIGDAYASLLGDPAIPVLQGAWGELRGVGRKDPGLVCCAPGSPIDEYLASGVNILILEARPCEKECVNCGRL